MLLAFFLGVPLLLAAVVAFATRKRRPGFYRDVQVPDPLTTRGTLANRFRIQDDTFNNDYR